jgi:hypothetical protein
MQPDQAPNPSTPQGQAVAPDAAPRRGYLYGVLADGARPFLYRGRVRSLLGLPETSGVNLSFISTDLVPGLTYARPRLAEFYEQPADLLTSIADELVQTEDLTLTDAPAHQAALPAADFTLPSTRSDRVAPPAATVGPAPDTPRPGIAPTVSAVDTPRAANEAARPQPARPVRGEPATGDLPGVDAQARTLPSPQPHVDPSPQLTHLAIPGTRPRAPVPPTPDGPSSNPSETPTDDTVLPTADRHETQRTETTPLPSPPQVNSVGATAVTSSSTPSGRWQPAQTAATPAMSTFRRPPDAVGKRVVADAAGETVAGPAPAWTAQPGAGPVSGFPQALPYLGAGAQGESRSGSRGRQTRPPADESADDWPTSTRPSLQPAPQVVVVRAPASSVRESTPAFWERSHLHRLRTRILR